MTEFRSRFAARSYALVLPKADREEIDRYIAKDSVVRTSRETVPFARQVDFWAFSIATALAYRKKPLEARPSTWGKTFIYTAQNILSNDLCALLSIVAIDRMGHDNPNAINPSRIIDLANRLAGAGCPLVLKALSDNSFRTTPLDRVIEMATTLEEKVRDSLSSDHPVVLSD